MFRWLAQAEQSPAPAPRRSSFSDLVPALLILGVGIGIFVVTVYGTRGVA